MAANTDKFKKLARRWVGQIGAGGVADGVVTTVPLAASTNLPTDTAVVAVIDRVDTSGTTTATLEETVIGVVSGTDLITCTRGAEGSAQAHAAGAVVEILFTAKGWGDLVDGIQVQHNQLGLHTNVTACNVTASGIVTSLTAVVTGQTTLSDVDACAVTATTIVASDNVTVADGKDIKFTSGAKIECDDGHLKLTPESGKEVELVIAAKARVYLSGNQLNLTDDTWTKVDFDTENYDIGSDYDTTNKRFVAPVTGYYAVTVAVNYVGGTLIADKRYYSGIYVNGALYSAAVSQTVTTDTTSSVITDIIPITAGQYIEGYARVVCGAATVDIDASSGVYTYMSIHLLSV